MSHQSGHQPQQVHHHNHLQPSRAFLSAEKFYTDKLVLNPEMPRYNHLLASLSSAKGSTEKANSLYRTAIGAQPGNIMTRNDYGVHLARHDRKHDALHEFKKAMLITEENATLQKNYAAILGNSGQLQQALDTATRARFLNPDDAMNHRNLAKIHGALGDSHTALEHNLASVRLENPRNHPHPHTSAYRAAAVQIIAKGGSREEAHALMDAARSIEHKKIELSTSVQTYEIISKIKRRYGQSMADIEKQKLEELSKLKAYDYDDKDNILHEIRKMHLTRSIKT